MEPQPAKKRLFRRFFLIILVAIVLVAVAGWLYLQFHEAPKNGEDSTAVAIPPSSTMASSQAAATMAAEFATLPPDAPALDHMRQEGLIILAMGDGLYTHLFAWHPMHLQMTRLTDGPWDDIHPAISPDGTRVAFSSRQNGYWDLFILDMASGVQTRITDTPEYDGAPSWSPDGQWLAYESYTVDNLEIWVLSIADPSNAPVRLTEDPAADTSPAWSPGGREIAFISTRSGGEEVWLARLDNAEDRYVNLSRNDNRREQFPAWSPDGRYLAWGSDVGGESSLLVWDSQAPANPAIPVGTGNHPVWSPRMDAMLGELRGSNQTELVAYSLEDGALLFPPFHLAGDLQGLDWHAGNLADLVAAFPFPANSQSPSSALYEVVLTTYPMPPAGRFGIVPLNDVSAPYAYLHDEVDEAFNALRVEVGRVAGWDFLSSLENAYVPLTDPPMPGMLENWLYTGRAFAFNPLPTSAGWVVVVREDYLGLTFWRVYLKARYQDGSQGQPIRMQPWDFSARHSNDPVAYEAGGRPAAIPAGYWIDFTALAREFGWERQPSLNEWRTYYPAIRFNQFVLTSGLDWNAAMAEVYPPEFLATATLRPTFTTTPSRTPEASDVRTATGTAQPSLTPTRRPTLTPLP